MREKQREEIQELSLSEIKEEIIQPCNDSIKLYEESKHGEIVNFPRKSQEISPTEFLANNDEYGRLKGNNESIFSFGTSRNSLTKHDNYQDSIRSSQGIYNSAEQVKLHKKLHLNNLKDFEISLKPKRKEPASISPNKQSNENYISDGRPQSLQRSACPKIMEKLLISSKNNELLQTPPKSCRNRLDNSSESNKLLLNELSDRKSRKIKLEHYADDRIFNLAQTPSCDERNSSPLKQTSEFAIKGTEIIKDLFDSKKDRNSQIMNFKERIQMIKYQRENGEDRVKLNMNQQKVFENNNKFDKSTVYCNPKLENKDTIDSYQIEEDIEISKDEESEEPSSMIIKPPFSNSIEAIQEVDESEFVTDEKLKVSPNWGKAQVNNISQDDQRIPFILEEITTHRIGSGSKYQRRNEFGQQTDFEQITEESIQTFQQEHSSNQSLQTENILNAKSQELQTECNVEVNSQATQSQFCNRDEAIIQTENEICEKYQQTENETIEKYLQVKVEQREQDLQTEESKQSEQDIQTESMRLIEVNIQTENSNTEIDVQTYSKIFSDSIVQTNNLVSEKYLQTEFHEECKSIQTSTKIDKKNVQTTPIKELCDKELSNQSIQSEENKDLMEDVAVQSETYTSERSQYVCMQQPQFSETTQTTNDDLKETRTGGVQVCIGNRIHLRQLKLANILNKLTLDKERETSKINCLYSNSFMMWKVFNLKSKSLHPSKIDYSACIPKLESKLCKLKQSLVSSVFSKFKNNTIKCMVFDQEKSMCNQEKYSELEDAVNQLIKQNETLQDKLLYYEDLLEKKDFDLKARKQESKEAQKKIQELKNSLEDLRKCPKSSSSQTAKGDTTNSFKSERKSSMVSSNLNSSTGSKNNKYYQNQREFKQTQKRVKIISDPRGKPLKGSKKAPAKIQKKQSNGKSQEVPTVELNFTAPTVEKGVTKSINQNKSLCNKREPLHNYMPNNTKDQKKAIISNFVPSKSVAELDESTIEICEQKKEAVRRMSRIMKNHILMNYMIRWIENGFMHFPEGSVNPIPEKDEVLECSAIEKEEDHFLHPITEESLGEMDGEIYGRRISHCKFEKYRREKLRKVLQMCQKIENNPEILKLKAFKEWKRLGIKLSLEKLLEYREALDKLQSLPLSDEDYYYEGEDSDLSLV